MFFLFVTDFTVEVVPKYSPEVLSTVPKCDKAVMCLTEKICVLDKLCSHMSSSAVGHDVIVN